jgi:hypothetical protein
MAPPPDHGEKSWVGAGQLEGMTAVITGGGIGRAVAIAYAREGADVAIRI